MGKMELTPQEIKGYIDSKGWKYKTVNGQYQVETCPWCNNNESKLYMEQSTGAWICHRCKEAGNLYTIQKFYGDTPVIMRLKDVPKRNTLHVMLPVTDCDKWHQQLLGNDAALSYLQSRGFNGETIHHFRLGYCIKRDNPYICIPHMEGKTFVNAKFRRLGECQKNERFTRVINARSILFNKDCIPKYEEIMITEAETGAMMFWQQGFKNVISVTCGAGSFDHEWIEDLRDKKKIYIVYDTDSAGQEGAKKVAKLLGYSRCYNIILNFQQEGLKDVNEYFSVDKKTKEDFQKLIDNSNRFEIENINGLMGNYQKFKKSIMNPEEESEYLSFTPWENVNNIIKIKKGNLIALLAAAKTGKTTLALNIAMHNARRMPVLFYCVEMMPEEIISKIIQLEMNVTEEGITNSTFEAVEKAGIMNLPVYQGYNGAAVAIQSILSAIEEAVNMYGIKLVIFDNLHYVCRDLRNSEREIASVTKAFKDLAIRLQIAVFLLCQPRKTEANAILTTEDAKGSSAIGTDVDMLITLWRKRIVSLKSDINDGIVKKETQSNVTLVRIEASRNSQGAETLLYYKGEHSKFTVYQKGNYKQYSRENTRMDYYD